MIQCDKIERGVCHPQLDGFVKINASSSGPLEWRGLSPFLLGPIEINSTDKLVDETYWTNCSYAKLRQCLIFENYWQGSKIYNIDIDTDGEILPSFFRRRQQMCDSIKPKRRAVPKSKGYPIAGFYRGKIMGYVESRKKIYCPLYAKLISRTDEFSKLKKMLADGQNLLIVGPDGRDIPLTKKSLLRAVNDPNHIFGHELVICCLLLNLKVWNM